MQMVLNWNLTPLIFWLLNWIFLPKYLLGSGTCKKYINTFRKKFSKHVNHISYLNVKDEDAEEM